MSTRASVTAAAAGPLLAAQIPPVAPVSVQPPPTQDASQAVQSVAAPPPVARPASPGPDSGSGGSPPASEPGGYAADGTATAPGGRSLIDIKV